MGENRLHQSHPWRGVYICPHVSVLPYTLQKAHFPCSTYNKANIPQPSANYITYQKMNADNDLRPNGITACAFGIAIATSAVIARVIDERRWAINFGWDN